MGISSSEAARHEASLSLLGSRRTLGGVVSCELHFKHTGDGLAFCSTVWLPYFLDNKLEVDHIPLLVLGVFYHLGLEGPSGYHCTAIKDDGTWWVYDDVYEPVKFSALPLVVPENCSLLWMSCCG